MASLREVSDLHSEISGDLARHLSQVEAQGLKAWTAKCKETAAVRSLEFRV